MNASIFGMVEGTSWARIAGWSIGAAILLEVLLIASAFLWVAIYSYVIHPGQSMEAYQAYAQQVSGWVSVAVGIPLFFLACLWLGHRFPGAVLAVCVATVFVYSVLDTGMLAAAPQKITWTVPAISLTTKWLSALTAAWWVMRSA